MKILICQVKKEKIPQLAPNIWLVYWMFRMLIIIILIFIIFRVVIWEQGLNGDLLLKNEWFW